MNFFTWLATPFRATRACFPFSSSGLATLIYLMFSGAAVALSAMTIWAMSELKLAGRWHDFAALADRNSWALMIVIGGFSMFVSVRAVKLGPFEMSGFRDDRNCDDLPAPPCEPPSAS